MNKKEIANCAADLIEERGWCQGAMSRDKRGKPVHPNDDSSCSIDLVSALVIASRSETKEDVLTLFSHFKNLTDSIPVGLWNDEEYRTKEDVIELLRSVE